MRKEIETFAAFMTEKWYALPTLSAILLVATFYPFNLWMLAPVALTPLYYFATLSHRFGNRKIFLGAMLTGLLFAFSLAYMSVIQFHWLTQVYLFEYAVRISFVPIALASASMCGASLLAYGIVRKRLMARSNGSISSRMLAVFFGAGLYTLSEIILGMAFKGYYLGTLAYALHKVPFMVSLASLGGTSFVSFLVALTSVSLVEAFDGGRRATLMVLAGIVVTIGLHQTSSLIFRNNVPSASSVSIALIQNNDRSDAVFGSVENGSFKLDGPARLLEEASKGSQDLIIYPFSPVNGAIQVGPAGQSLNKNILVATDTQVGAWIASHVPADTVVMTWSTVYEKGIFTNEALFWKNGAIASRYAKRRLFPFMDYTPAFAQKIGLFSTPIDGTAGPEGQAPLLIGDVPVRSVICSEINDQGVFRRDSRTSHLIINAGSEAMFADDAVSTFNFASSKYRAAENGITLVRANKFGPSGIIDPRGRALDETSFNEDKILFRTIHPEASGQTPFNRTGNAPIYLIVLLSLLLPLWASRSKKA